jgi:putative tryptophan/tyrosine transport system substrate-binding protein
MAMSPCRTICALVVVAALCWGWSAGVRAAEDSRAAVVRAEEPRAAVVVSRKIRPYIQVMEGVVQQVADRVGNPDLLFLDPENSQVQDQVARRLKDGAYDLVCAVGPEAAAMVWDPGVPGKKMYAAVLDPESVPGLPADACGISLRIPVPLQVDAIAKTFPLVTRIGLLFDPANNAWFFDAATRAARDLDLEIIALQVDGRTRIAPVLKNNFSRVDLIWIIPDQTIISEKIIHYVIKQGLYQETGVIGYNPFFTRSGALFSFEFDYRDLGRQAGRKLLTLMNGNECPGEPPEFHTIVNEKVADKIQVRWMK